jgi:hypothetical protein
MRRFRIVYAVSVSVAVLLLVGFGAIGWLTGRFTVSDCQRNETTPLPVSADVAASIPEAEESVHAPDYDPTSTTAKTAQASDSPDFDVAAAPKVTQPLLAWAAAYFVASESEKSAMLPKGVELAQARRTVLFEMIKTDPEAAWEAALPRAVHAQLPDEIRTHLETFVHTVLSIRIEYSCAFTGDGEHVHAAGEIGDHLDEHQHYVTLDERDYRAYVYGSRLRNLFVQNTSIHGIAIDRHLAISESRARLLEPGESLPTSTTAPTPGAVAVEADGKVSILDSAEALTTFEASLIEAEEDPYLAELGDGAAGSSDVVGRVAASQTIGEKRALVMLVDFDDYPGRPVTPGGITMTEDFIVGVMSGMNGVSQFLRENSYGKTSVIVSPTVDGDSPDVTEVLRMPYTASVYANTRGRTQLYLDARAVASSNGYDVASYDRLICVPSNLSGFDGGTLFTGWAGVAASPGTYTVINGYFDIRTLNHELGHNYGVLHSSLWKVADGNPISLATNAVSEGYGDRYDTMGADAGHVTKHYNQWFKNFLWWIPDDTITPAEETGIYRVFRLDHKDANLNLPRAIKIERDDVRNYWIGYRTVNYHTNINEKAYVLWGYKSRRDSHLLDMNTPGTSIDDAGLELGQTFDDVDAGISFSPVAKGGSGADEWMDIQVTFVPRLVFASTSVTAGENIGYAAVKVNRMCNPAGAVSVSYATSPGTAVAPADYTTTSGTLTWDDGDASTKTIQVPLVDDGISEPPETFALSLSSPVGAMFWDGGASITTTVTVLDYYDGPPTISWATPVKQDIGLPYGVGLYIDVSIEDDGAGGGSVSCLWQTGSAPVGESVSWDSQNTTNTAVVFSGDGDYTLRILAMDGVNTTTQDLFVTVGATERYGINFGPVVEAGADLVDFVNTDVVLGGSVSDDGLPGASITTQWLQFDGPATATFGDASIPTSTVSASTAGTYTLRLTADDGQIKTFDDTSYNALSTTGAGYFRFTTDQRSVAEDDSNLEVFVERLGGKQGAVSVDYAATDGSATNGIDYVLSSGTLSWANNQTGTKSFQVSILSDLQSESDETFTLQLTNATGGAGILSPSNMVVTIIEPPRVNNSTGAIPLTVTSSRLRGEVEAGVGSVAWICWGLQDAGNNSTGLWEHVEAIGTVNVGTPFAVDVTGLDTNATYYYRCFVTNISGTAWSSSPAAFSGIPAYSGDQDIGAIVPVTTLNFDAHDPASGVDDNNWNSLNSTNTYDWDFGADVTLVSVTSAVTVLQKAYRFTGGSGDSGGATWDGWVVQVMRAGKCG